MKTVGQTHPYTLSERNKKKYKKNSFFSSVWKFKYEGMGRNEKIIPLFESLSEGNEMKYSFLLISSKSQFSFLPKLGGIGVIEILFNEIFTKTPKMPLIFFFKY